MAKVTNIVLQCTHGCGVRKEFDKTVRVSPWGGMGVGENIPDGGVSINRGKMYEWNCPGCGKACVMTVEPETQGNTSIGGNVYGRDGVTNAQNVVQRTTFTTPEGDLRVGFDDEEKDAGGDEDLVINLDMGVSGRNGPNATPIFTRQTCQGHGMVRRAGKCVLCGQP